MMKSLSCIIGFAWYNVSIIYHFKFNFWCHFWCTIRKELNFDSSKMIFCSMFFAGGFFCLFVLFCYDFLVLYLIISQFLYIIIFFLHFIFFKSVWVLSWYPVLTYIYLVNLIVFYKVYSFCFVFYLLKIYIKILEKSFALVTLEWTERWKIFKVMDICRFSI